MSFKPTATTTRTGANGFALLIKAHGAIKRFVPREGETITILDKDGKEVWSLKLPPPNANPGINLQEVQIDLLTEREFSQFCQKTWSRGGADQSGSSPTPPPNPA